MIQIPPYLKITAFFFTLLVFATACTPDKKTDISDVDNRIRLIFDTDANNELDDQHALAYLLFNGDVFDVEAVTVNATFSGGNIDLQYAEAERVVQLCGMYGTMPLLKGADASFPEILPYVMNDDFDGAEAVNFIIDRSMADEDRPLLLLMVGKLTNAALAIEKQPTLVDRIKILWLGSNYPDPGEYNQDNDTAAMNYLLNTGVEFEIALVRYGKVDGTDAVRATRDEIGQRMPGQGLVIDRTVEGRHGGSFNNFGDYSVNLFEHISYHGDDQSRALFDMAAVAILKNPEWASRRSIPAPIYLENQWVERPDNSRSIVLWEFFDRDGIMEDFYRTMEQPVLAPAHTE